MITSQHKAQICFFKRWKNCSSPQKSGASRSCEDKVEIWKMLNNINLNLIVSNPVITHQSAEAEPKQVSSLGP